MLVLDVQGFQLQPNEFIVKELAIEWLSKDHREVMIFDPPCHWNQLPAKYKATNGWLFRNYHGLPWDSFGEQYENLKKTIQKKVESAKIIFVKGSQKKQWLKLYTDKMVINLEDFGCPRYFPIENIVKCKIHEKCSLISYHACAFENAQKLAAWFRKYFHQAVEEATNNSFYWTHRIEELIADDDEVEFLEEFLTAFAFPHIDMLWEKLPNMLKSLRRIEQYRRCRDHHHSTPPGADAYDGPPPMKRDCHQCQEQFLVDSGFYEK